MKANGISTFKIAATYIGTVVGAGFASGQEILQFFAVFGSMGLVGLLIVTLLFMVLGYIIMELGHSLKAGSHLKIVRFAGGRYIGSLIDFIITFFLFGALTAMIAGSGAMLEQQFGIPSIWGNLVMAAVTVVTVLTGIEGVIKSVSFAVPFLLVSAVGISIGTVFIAPAEPGIVQTGTPANGLISNWLWAAVLYTSYNTVLSIAVLGPLGSKAESRRAIRRGAILGGLGLGLGAAAIFLALSRNITGIMNMEVPMAFIAGRISLAIQIIYVVVLLAEIYTTAVGSLFGFTARMEDMKMPGGRLLIIGSALLALIASRFGFSNLVRYLYPLVGYGGIVMLLGLLYAGYKMYMREKTRPV